METNENNKREKYKRCMLFLLRRYKDGAPVRFGEREKIVKNYEFNKIKSGDSLTMVYFDNHNNGSLNKYKKILKIKKSL
jgi:hypothetical protein